MKGRRFLVLCLALFAIGCLGRVLLHTPEKEPVPFSLTVTAESLDNLLLPALPRVGDEVCVGAVAGRVTGVFALPRELIFRDGGKEKRIPSRLFSRIALEVALDAGEQNGLPVLGATPSFLGDEVSVWGKAFVFHGRLLAFSRRAVGENA